MKLIHNHKITNLLIKSILYLFNFRHDQFYLNTLVIWTCKISQFSLSLNKECIHRRLPSISMITRREELDDTPTG